METIATEDVNCFETMLTMLQTLNAVACDELGCQGHTLECSQMLCAVVQTSGQLYIHAKKCLDAMTTRVLGSIKEDCDD